MFQNSCISRLCDNDRRSFARLYQYQTNNFSAQRSNFHSVGVAKTESTESTESSESSESGESGVYRPEKSLQIYSLYFIDDG